MISKLDFGFWHDEIHHTKWDWFYTKINKPATFDLIPNDDGTLSVKELNPLDKSRMPHYGLTDKEINGLVTLIMGLVKDEIPESKLPEKTPKYLATTEGERFVQLVLSSNYKEDAQCIYHQVMKYKPNKILKQKKEGLET